MNAKVETLFHYRDVEQQAREIAKAQAVIRELRGELHDVICEIQRTASAIRDVDALIARAKATLSRTQPELEELDAMSKPQRKSELVACISDMFGVKARP